MTQAAQPPRWRRWLARAGTHPAELAAQPSMARAGAAELAGLAGDIISKSNGVHERLERLTVADRLLVLMLLADTYPDQVAKVMDWAEVDQC